MHTTLIMAQSIAFRSCYFTVESTKKFEFIKCFNSSYKLACLQCSFIDKEVRIHPIESSKLPKKYAVIKIGKQADSTWVFPVILTLHLLEM